MEKNLNKIVIKNKKVWAQNYLIFVDSFVYFIVLSKLNFLFNHKRILNIYFYENWHVINAIANVSSLLEFW